MNIWREKARPLIARVIRSHEGKPIPEIRKALREAYPFGERRYWPYKIWCDEVRFQLGLKKYNPEPMNPRQKGIWDVRN